MGEGWVGAQGVLTRTATLTGAGFVGRAVARRPVRGTVDAPYLDSLFVLVLMA